MANVTTGQPPSDHDLRWDAEYDAYYCNHCFTYCATLAVHSDDVEGCKLPTKWVFALGAIVGWSAGQILRQR